MDGFSKASSLSLSSTPDIGDTSSKIIDMEGWRKGMRTCARHIRNSQVVLLWYRETVVSEEHCWLQSPTTWLRQVNIMTQNFFDPRGFIKSTNSANLGSFLSFSTWVVKRGRRDESAGAYVWRSCRSYLCLGQPEQLRRNAARRFLLSYRRGCALGVGGR